MRLNDYAMKKTIITIILTLMAMVSFSQKLPDWIINKPSPTNSTYLYVVESATGQTEMQARNRAIGEVFRSTAMRIGQPFDSEEINRALQRGTEYYVISSQYNIPINKVCEYTDNKVSPCRVYVLCQVAKAGNIRVEFDDFNACYEGADKIIGRDALYADGFTISQNGRMLSDSEIRTMFANSKSYDLYDKGKRIEEQAERATLGIVGVLLLCPAGLCQLGWLDYNNHEWDSNSSGKGFVITGAVIGGFAIGMEIIELIRPTIGRAKIRKAVNLYNNGRMYSQSDYEIEYGLTENGIYLSFWF